VYREEAALISGYLCIIAFANWSGLRLVLVMKYRRKPASLYLITYNGFNLDLIHYKVNLVTQPNAANYEVLLTSNVNNSSEFSLASSESVLLGGKPSKQFG
jgi:hypothetical protein